MYVCQSSQKGPFFKWSDEKNGRTTRLNLLINLLFLDGSRFDCNLQLINENSDGSISPSVPCFGMDIWTWFSVCQFKHTVHTPKKSALNSNSIRN